MKKLIAGLFAAILTTAGFVAVTSSAPASAACTQYVCNDTKTKVNGAKSVNAGKSAKVKVKVSTRGNVRPTGSVTVTITGPGGYSKTFTKTTSGSNINVNLGKLKKPGKYKVSVTYVGDNGFRDSAASTTITVKKKKK